MNPWLLTVDVLGWVVLAIVAAIVVLIIVIVIGAVWVTVQESIAATKPSSTGTVPIFAPGQTDPSAVAPPVKRKRFWQRKA